MSVWFHAVVLIFPLQLFTTRVLNKGAPDIGIWCVLWTIERVCLALVVAGFVTVQFWLVQIAMTASVALYLSRAVVRCVALGFWRIAAMTLSGLSVFGEVAGAFFIGLVEAVPEALAEAAESDSESEAESTGSGPWRVGVYKWSYDKITDWEW